MTISSEVNSVTYNGPGNGFAYSYPVFAPADVYVVIRTDAGAYQYPTLDGAGTYDYAVTGTYDTTAQRYLAGVTVTLNTALPSGYTVAIECRPALTQSADFAAAGALPAETLETVLDRQIVVAQRISTQVGRSLQLSPTSSYSGDLLLPEPSANRGLKWNSSADGLVNSTYDPDAAQEDAAAQVVLAAAHVGLAADQVALADAARAAAEAAYRTSKR